MVVTRKQKQQLKKFIKELSVIRGRHTELVSVYIPQGYDIIKIIQHLAQEQGTASNIKDARTRKNVIDSLEKTIRHLRLYKRTPENGLAVFAGNASTNESKIDLKVWSIEPPEPIKTRLYRCDQTFVLDVIKEMVESKDMYGLVVMDKREASIGFLKGTRIEMTHHSTSGVPGKTRAGGQSAQRFARLREGAAKEFFKRIAEYMNAEFLGKKGLKGIIIGGPGHTKQDFFDKDYINTELKRKVLGLKDLTYTDESGLHDLVEKSQDLLAAEEVLKEKEIMQKFFNMLAKDPDKVTYGMAEVKKALELGAVETLLLSEDLDDNLIESLEEQAEKVGSEVEIISTETREGGQLKDLTGIAAILRYALS